MCGYVDDLVSFEMNHDYSLIIEKKAENLYRTISQKQKSLPTSNQAVTRTILRTQQMDLTPQESEQLSQYVADDSYVKKQKEDIEELASMFKDKLSVQQNDTQTEYITELESHFVPQGDFTANYLFMIEEKKKPLVVEVAGEELNCYYGQQENVDVYAKLTGEVMNNILAGRMTFQRAFMTGEMTAKGNFKTLRTLDQIFIFEQKEGVTMKDDNCIFCKLAAGDIPTNTVYEDDTFRVIMDANPATKGHSLIIPKDHFANLYEMDEEVAAKAMKLAKKMAVHMKEKLNCDGFNLLQNNEETAGQTVFHFHMHLIPRYKGDKNDDILKYTPLELSDDEMKEILDMIKVK